MIRSLQNEIFHPERDEGRETKEKESEREQERENEKVNLFLSVDRNDLARKEWLYMTVLFVGVNTVDVYRLWKTFMTMAWIWIGFKCGCLKKSIHKKIFEET